MRPQLVCVFLVLASALPLTAQNTEEERLLMVRRANLNLRESASDLAKKKKLLEQGLAAPADVEKTEAEYERAKIDYQMAELALSNELPSFRVRSAVKTLASSGTTYVRLTLEPQSNAMAHDGPRSYFVSVVDEGTIVGEPYQQKVTVSTQSSAIVLSYKLLRDVDNVSVLIVSGSKREEVRLLLQRDSNHVIRLTCDDCSQEGALGAKVEYRLALERFDTRDRGFRIEVRGLPVQFTFNIVDADTHASLTAVRFPQTVVVKKLLCDIYLPQSSDPTLIGTVLPIDLTVLPTDGRAVLATVRLQLRPQGSPRIVLTSDNLLITTARGHSAETTLGIRNVGGSAAPELAFDFEPPTGIVMTIDPNVVPLLKPQQTIITHVIAKPTADAVPGDYSVAVRARTRDRTTAIDSPEITFRVTVSRNAGGPWTAFGIVVLLVTGLGAFAFFRRTVS